ncbi:LysM peptidoglycan-binding domain-containing protein [Pelagicoccus albus]|uniref:LysM peptidoglycan-binding domain-containing protein n=1 Tax=Pelagicoccus albus TaxID=415222 RepID=A0A7X1E8I9_9BACT|nr:LysM domain-containing protein [Pelagicoccus albus]MBC2606213.1 LysM peptidoglycan-binding domain-containing protein [Pelagicoccus albus]
MTRLVRFVPAFFAFALVFTSQLSAQSSNLQYQVANMVEDQRLMMEQMRALLSEMDDMRRENARLKSLVEDLEGKVQRQSGNYATVAQVNEVVRKAVTALEARDETLRNEMVNMVGDKLEAFGKTVNKALNSVPTMPAPRKDVKTNFDTSGIPTTGVPHEVAPGESISSIAKKYNSRSDWIQNINKISDPRLLQVGQTIFVPQDSQ